MNFFDHMQPVARKAKSEIKFIVNQCDSTLTESEISEGLDDLINLLIKVFTDKDKGINYGQNN